MKNDIQSLWHAISYRYSPSRLVDLLGFTSGLQACRRIAQSDLNGEHHFYTMVMLETLRHVYPEKWSASWQYDAYLGYIYWMICDSDQTYIAYTRALAKSAYTPPPQLLLSIAECFHCPGEPPIRCEEAIFLTKQIMQHQLYLEGIDLLIFLYKSSDNLKEQKYWEQKKEELKDKLTPLPPIWELPETGNEWAPPSWLLEESEN